MTYTEVYREPFRRWDDLSWIRKGPIRSGELDGLMFSPELSPLASHAALANQPGLQQRVIAYRLITHLHFTTVLELEHVNHVCSEIARGSCPVFLDLDKRNDALRIYCDEGGHALFVELLLRRVEQHFGVSRNVVGRPYFDEVLARIVRESQVGELLTRLLFVCVSETLVSKILRDIPDDARVASIVRAVIADHAEDESRHSTYFQWLFPLAWQKVSPQHRGAVAAMLAEFLQAFLGPDLGAERRVLESLGLPASKIDDVLAELYGTAHVRESINESAQPTLRMFERSGLFESAEVRDVFAERGLAPRGN